MIELYAISQHPAPPLPESAGPVLSSAAVGDLAVIWAPQPAESASSPTLEILRSYEATVEMLMADRDVLPMRFGTRVANVGAAVRAIDERREDLARALQRVRGATEVAVRVAAACGAASDPARASEAVHRRLSEIALAAQRQPALPGELLRAAYLVDRREVDAFAGVAASLQNVGAGLHVLCTGPWPPYSFTRPG